MQVKAYPNFNTLNTRARCNTLKLPATQLIYQSAGNFLGLDSVTVEVIFPGGSARRIRMPISVRPVAPTFAPAPPPGAETVVAVPRAPVALDRPKKVVRHARSVAAAAPRHRTCKSGCETSGPRPSIHTAAPKAPLVNI